MLTPITPARAAEAVSLLDEGFPERGPAFWQRSLQQILDWPGNALAGYPPGFFWLEKEQPVGILLTPASPRGGPDGRIVVNVSSWYLRPDFRWKAPLMLRAVFRDPGPVFTDLTPTPEVQAMLPAFGFRPINPGIGLQLTPLLALRPGGDVRVRAWQPDDRLDGAAPPPELIGLNRDRGFATLVIEQGPARHLCVFRPFRYRSLPAAFSIFIGSHAALPAAWPAIARHLLARGILVVQCDVRAGVPHPLALRRRGLWFAKGETFDDRTDHLGSELCLLDL
ncbi:MAG: hypothetical protein O9322_06945 [Beijerinckiaceae bacterium]|nr:hypothetical protein [Beijerinckiaceae bacterium]MCZ8299261.1 hypothetical protein [Beijerinckiaceae bacterium]